MTTSHCVADPASEDTFVCWNISEDVVGESSSGWYAYRLSDNSWSRFSSLGISSMPPLWSNRDDVGSTPVTHVTIPEYGVSVWLAQRTDGGGGGMYVYKHSVGTGDPLVTPDPPPNFRTKN
jgi:hypothetical protein